MNVQQLLSSQIIGPVSAFIGALITVVGTLYLAYDLIGERHGFLRTLTEAITYVIIGIVFGTLALGIIAWDAVAFDPYFVPAVTVAGAVAVLLAFGAVGGMGFGLGYVLTIERKWNGGHPTPRRSRPFLRVLSGLGLGVFEGLLVYAVMDNFRNVHGPLSGLYWGAIQGPPAGLLFGFLVAVLIVRFHGSGSGVDGRGASFESVGLSDAESAAVATQRARFDVVGLLAGVAIGAGVGPVTAMSYFALYGPFVPETFINISLAGLVGGTVVGLVAATAERALLWVDRLPPKRLGITGAFLVFLGFLFEASSQVLALVAALSKTGISGLH